MTSPETSFSPRSALATAPSARQAGDAHLGGPAVEGRSPTTASLFAMTTDRHEPGDGALDDGGTP
jgi:hypothetical protein